MQRVIRSEEISFIRQDIRKGQPEGGAEEKPGGQAMTEEMASEYAEPEFDKCRKVGGVIPPMKKSVKRMIWDRAVSCFRATCFSSPSLRKNKKKTAAAAVPPATRRIFAAPNH